MLDRRRFLTGLVGAGVAGAGVVACSDDDTDASGEPGVRDEDDWLGRQLLA